MTTKRDTVTVERAVKDPDGPAITVEDVEVAVSERDDRPVHLEVNITPREQLTQAAYDEVERRRVAGRPVHVETSLTPAASFLPGATPDQLVDMAPVHIETAISPDSAFVHEGIVDLDEDHTSEPLNPAVDIPRRRDRAVAQVHPAHGNPAINPTPSTPDQWVEGAPETTATESTPDQVI